jgi:DNA-directed RNA polymerase specialized sigma subunit
MKKPLKSQLYLQDIDMEEIMESDLEDNEIAAELGITTSQVSKIRRELFEE